MSSKRLCSYAISHSAYENICDKNKEPDLVQFSSFSFPLVCKQSIGKREAILKAMKKSGIDLK